MSSNHSDARATAERVVDRLQEFFHVASGPNQDGTHSGFIVVDFEEADVVMGDEAPTGAVAFLPFDLSDEDEPTELTTADDDEAAADAAGEMLGTLLNLIEAVLADELGSGG